MMDKICILLTKPKNNIFPIISWLIRLVERTKFSHTVNTWHIHSLDRDIYFESTGGGVNFLCEELHMIQQEVVEAYEYSIPKSELKVIAQFCHDNSGKKYSKKQMVGLLLMRFLRLFNIKIANPFRDGDHSQICVETTLLILHKCGILPEKMENIENYGLQEIHKLLIKTGKKRSIYYDERS